MKAVLLAGGTGSRLAPLTRVTNKHLLPVYNKPMIFYPLEALKKMGVTDVLLISGKGHAGHFLELLGNGEEFGLHLQYDVQSEPKGIAHALMLAERFVGQEPFIVMLGDNVFEDDLSHALQEFQHSDAGAHIFLKEVPEPQHYGVPVFEGTDIVDILEKPFPAPSSYAVTGLYFYRPEIFEWIKTLEASPRGELEISSVNQYYAKEKRLRYHILENYWGDCGESIDQLMKVSLYLQTKERR